MHLSQLTMRYTSLLPLLTLLLLSSSGNVFTEVVVEDIDIKSEAMNTVYIFVDVKCSLTLMSDSLTGQDLPWQKWSHWESTSLPLIPAS